MTRDEALKLARSDSWSERAKGARALARYSDAEAEQQLRELLDDENLYVIQEVGEHLLRRSDEFGVRLVSVAISRARAVEDNQTEGTLLWVIDPLIWAEGSKLHELFERVRDMPDPMASEGAGHFLRRLETRRIRGDY